MRVSNATKTTLLLLAMTTMMSNVAIITSLPHFSDHFPHQEHIGFLSRMMITVPSLSIALLAPFLGHFLARFSRRATLGAGLLLFSVAGSAGLYLDGMEAMLLSRALFGVAVGILMIVTTSLVGDYFTSDERHRYMGLQSAFSSFGGLLLLIGGGVLSDMAWRYPFGIYLIGLAYLPLVWRFIVEPRHPNVSIQDDEENKNLLGIYLLAFVLMLVFYVLPTQMPFLMINHFGASGKLTGAIIAMAFVFNALGALTFSTLKKHFDFMQIYIIGMAVIATGFVLIGLVRDVYFFFLTSPVMGFGGGILMTNITAWMLHKAHHKKRVRSSGYLSSALFMGQFFSPILFYPAVAALGVQHFFTVAGAALFVLIGLAVFIRRFVLEA